jgi:magnesium transporter
MTTDILDFGRTTWTNIVRPTPDDVKQLAERYPTFHPLDLEDILSRIERPKIDEYDDYLFVVMQFPLWDPVQRVSRSAEVDFFVGSGFVVTIHDGSLRAMNFLFEQCRDNAEVRQRLMGRGASRVFYAAIDRMVDDILPMIYKIDAKIRKLEETIFQESERAIIRELAYVRRDIIAMRRIMHPQVAILTNLENVDRPYIHEDLDVYFGDILDHLRKAEDMITDYGEVVAGLVDTTNTVATLYTNDIMRILTIISVIFLPLEVIVGFYGMNIVLPLQESDFAVGFVSGGMIGVAALMLYYFRHRNWI